MLFREAVADFIGGLVVLIFAGFVSLFDERLEPVVELFVFGVLIDVRDVEGEEGFNNAPVEKL